MHPNTLKAAHARNQVVSRNIANAFRQAFFAKKTADATNARTLMAVLIEEFYLTVRLLKSNLDPNAILGNPMQ